MKYLAKLLLVLLLAAGVTACSDYLEPSTPQSKPIESVNDLNDLEGLIIGAYSRLSQTGLYGRNWIIYNDVRTSNALSNQNSGRFDQFAILDYEVGSGYAEVTWDQAYEVIANINIIINSEVITEDESDEAVVERIQQVKGQAYALRAYTHMMLLLLYGQQYVEGSNLGIPYITTFGVQDNFKPSRLSVDESWARIGDDFQKAIDLLDPSVNAPSTRIDYYSARALQMRYFLYTEQYQNASTAALDIINSGIWTLIDAGEYLAAWGTDGEPQFIFGIAMTQTDNRGINGVSYIVLPGTGYGDVEITQQLYKLFGSDDVRQGLYSAIQGAARIHYRVTGKYPTRYINIPVIRYAEVILTYAEAQFQLGDLATALKFLNKVPLHRDADPYAVATLENILLERRKELAMEGHYYWDRLRYGMDIERLDVRPALAPMEISYPFGNYRLALPIPGEEILANPNIKQNQGYTGLNT